MDLPYDRYQTLVRTDKAMLIKLAEDGREVWLPASQVWMLDTGIKIADWIAEAKGIKAPRPVRVRMTARQRFARECADMARRDAEWRGQSEVEADAAARTARWLESV